MESESKYLSKEKTHVSVVIPAKNESASISQVISELKGLYPDFEIILVDDGSSDNTSELAKEAGAKVVSHLYSMGNGAAIKTGARAASGKYICFMDADGQHRPEDVGRLIEKVSKGSDMVVGARSKSAQASFLRGIGNKFYNWFASLMVGQKILDLTSGMRVVEADKFREFLYLLPNKFSYPTTITMAFFRSGYSVVYEPIEVLQREGQSHLNVWKDGIRFLLIIFKIGTLFSPLKIFLPLALFHFFLGVSYYGYTYITVSRFTNMSALLFTTSVTIFLMGLLSEQITALMFRPQKGEHPVNK